MSLKGFHVFFIGFAAASCIGFFLWTLLGPSDVVTKGASLFGYFSALIGLALAAYAVWFAKVKSKKIII